MRDTQQLDPFLADVFPNFGRSCTTKAFPQGGAYRTRAWCYVAEGVYAWGNHTQNSPPAWNLPIPSTKILG